MVSPPQGSCLPENTLVPCLRHLVHLTTPLTINSVELCNKDMSSRASFLRKTRDRKCRGSK